MKAKALIAATALSLLLVITGCAVEPDINQADAPEDEKVTYLSNTVYFPIGESGSIADLIEQGNAWLFKNNDRIASHSSSVINATDGDYGEQAPSGLLITFTTK